MRLRVEFTTEPFDLDEAPPHALVAREVIEAAELDAVDVGPFGNTAEGSADAVLTAVDALLRKTLESGKTSSGKPLTDEQRASLASDIHLAEGYLTVPDDFTPVLADVPVSDKLEIREPGCAIDVLALGHAHTTGDLVVHVADAGVVFVGDMVGWPVPLVGADQSRVREWSGTLKHVRDLGAKVIVPGHGPVMRDYTHLDRIATLMTAIAQRVDEARAGGKTLEAARGQIDLSDLRRQFAGDSPVHGALFDAYVAGPAVTNAWNIR